MEQSITQFPRFLKSLYHPSGAQAASGDKRVNSLNRDGVQTVTLAKLSLTLAFIFLSPDILQAATITAASCNQADVQTAVNSANPGGGDTVLIPPGTCTWSQRVNVPSVAMTIQGAGASSTRIIDGSTYPSATNGMIAWKTVSSGLHRITGIWFDGNAGGAKDPNAATGMIRISGNTGQWRFDHNIVQTERTTGMFFSNFVRGVNDNNSFILHNWHFGHYVLHDQWNNNANGCEGTVANGCGDASWADASNFGTSNFLFFETNTYTQAPSVGPGQAITAHDGWAGMRVVHRFNTYTNAIVADHGTDSSGRSRGARAWECYQNTFIMSNNFSSPSLCGTRGGTQRVFNNAGSEQTGGFFTQVYTAVNYRSDPGCASFAQCPPPWNQCNGTSPWDSGSYPCLDQVGRGQGTLIPSGAAPSPAGWSNEILDPVYLWGNTKNGSRSPAAFASPMVANRDIYDQPASFNGTVGVGVGTRSARPATCTTGVAYWSTDGGSNWNSINGSGNDGGLDRCSATNTWTDNWYTPFNYPHPLTFASSSPSAPPAPPQNLTVK